MRVGLGGVVRLAHPQRGPDRRGQEPDVALLDVAPVLAQMHGDPVGAAELGEDRGTDRVRLVGLSSLAHGRDMIDVDMETHLAFGEECMQLRGAGLIQPRRGGQAERLLAERAI